MPSLPPVLRRRVLGGARLPPLPRPLHARAAQPAAAVLGRPGRAQVCAGSWLLGWQRSLASAPDGGHVAAHTCFPPVATRCAHAPQLHAWPTAHIRTVTHPPPCVLVVSRRQQWQDNNPGAAADQGAPTGVPPRQGQPASGAPLQQEQEPQQQQDPALPPSSRALQALHGLLLGPEPELELATSVVKFAAFAPLF